MKNDPLTLLFPGTGGLAQLSKKQQAKYAKQQNKAAKKALKEAQQQAQTAAELAAAQAAAQTAGTVGAAAPGSAPADLFGGSSSTTGVAGILAAVLPFGLIALVAYFVFRAVKHRRK